MEEPKGTRPKVEKLPPYPQDVTVPRERCTFCGAEGISRMQGRNELIHFCAGCAFEVGFAFTGCDDFADPIERNEKIKTIVIERQQREREKRRG